MTEIHLPRVVFTELFPSHCGAMMTRRSRWRARLRIRVSIPLWCDDDTVERKVLGSIAEFPSHCGAMMTSACLSCFLRVAWFPSHCGAMMTELSAAIAAMTSAFPSHCGAMMTQLRQETCRKKNPVSIPLWCDDDRLFHVMDEYQQHVSIPLWCDDDGARKETNACPARVSIPLWCDDDSAFVGLDIQRPCCFHPTVVR